MILAAGNAKELWYLTRGTGVVALLLLTASVLLGVTATLGLRLHRWPRFAVAGMHRNLTLLSIAFVAVHVVTTVADGYAPIRLTDAVVPFVSAYRPVWLGLGAVAFDLLLAIVVTSLLRVRIGVRRWRTVHWLAYACWPVALVHGLGSGSDPRTSWLAAVAVGSVAVVVIAVVARVGLAAGPTRARAAGIGVAIVVPVVVLGWYRSGPLAPGWAQRAGTPPSLLPRVAAPAAVLTTAKPPRAFSSRVRGSVSQQADASGLVTVHLRLRLHDAPHGALRVDLRGLPSGGGVSLTASGVSFVPATTAAVYEGHVTGLEGNTLAADVVDAAGDHLRLTLVVSIDSSTNAVVGNVSAEVPARSEQD
ncbi:MAG TPA: ferric reductase-like transmembrane domain-containing protein [Gaiellaceae bacterium]